MKKIIIFYMLIMLLCLSSCGGYQIEGLQYPVIEAEHNIESETVSSYLLIKSSIVDEKMYYNFTIYSDFLRGTGRYYHYYQVDYKTNNDTIIQYYHVFDYTETERKYAQKFAPHERIDKLDEFNVAIDYEYKLDSEVVINETLKYHEDIIKLEDLDKYVNSDNIFDVILDKIDSENKYKFTIKFSEELGHFDFQAFIKTTDGEIFPFYGIYHYELKRGNYTTLSYEELASNIKIDEIYYKIIYYSNESANGLNYYGIIKN